MLIHCAIDPIDQLEILFIDTVGISDETRKQKG